MPISVAFPVNRPSKDRFYEIDHEITGLAFRLHNEFGRLLKESLYQTQFARLVNDAHLSISREVKVTVSFKSFLKDYCIDHLVESSVPIETKAVSALTGEHRAQLLNYLLLCDLQHGTLLNFRPTRVQHEFVSTHLTLAHRRKYTIHDCNESERSEELIAARELLIQLLDDWGTHLEIRLYRDALMHLFGAKALGMRAIDLFSNGISIGKQQIALLTEDVALSITASGHAEWEMKTHMQRFIDHTRLNSIVWINMHQSDVKFALIRGSR